MIPSLSICRQYVGDIGSGPANPFTWGDWIDIAIFQTGEVTNGIVSVTGDGTDGGEGGGGGEGEVDGWHFRTVPVPRK